MVVSICVVEGRAPVGADIKMLAMGLHHSHNLFRARAATKIDAHQRAQNLAILIAIPFASHPQCGVYGLSQKSIKMLHIGKIPPKGVSFSDFICTFAMSFGDFAILLFAALR